MKRSHIKEIIASYIENGITNYIIYPFGYYGVLVNQIMTEDFKIDPRYIIDNSLSIKNDSIIRFEQLKECRDAEVCFFILTAVDEELNRKMEEQLINAGYKEKIINLQTIVNKIYIPKELNKARDLLQINKIVPGDFLKKEKVGNSIKVGIVHPAISAYNSIKTICNAFEEDDKFNLTVILGETLRTNGHESRIENQMKSEHKKYLWSDQYRKKDKFDILILTNPYDMSWYGKIAEDAKLVVGAFFTLITYGKTDNFCRLVQKKTEIYNPDYYLFDSLMYNSLKPYPDFRDKLVEMGNAKFDEIYYISSQKDNYYPYEWEKLRGKKVVLWATSHGIFTSGISDSITFDIYAQHFFEYARMHTEMGFIFRPHDNLLKELIENEIWTEEDMDNFKEYCAQSPNIVYDDMDSYESAYSVADTIITEAQCGILISALPMLKPIAVMYRNYESQQMYYSKLMNNYYSICNKKDMWDFLDMVGAKKDPMFIQRAEFARTLIKSFDGKNGRRIKDYIADRYAEKLHL